MALRRLALQEPFPASLAMAVEKERTPELAVSGSSNQARESPFTAFSQDMKPPLERPRKRRVLSMGRF